MVAGPVPSSCLWCATSHKTSVQKYEDVYLVFHKASGDTHLLNFLSYAVFELLADQSLSVDDILARVRNTLQLTEEDCPHSLIVATLEQLDDVGLVYPAMEGTTHFAFVQNGSE